MINVEFRLIDDEDEVVIEDVIEYSFFKEFGYDKTNDLNIYEIISEEVDVFRDFKQSTIAVVLFASLPFIVNQGMRQYSDFLLAYLILGAGGLTLLYLHTKEQRVAVLAGLLIGLAGWVKMKG